MIYWEYHTTASKPTNYVCNQYGVPCSLANSNGYCKVSGCMYTHSHSETYHNTDLVGRSYTIDKDFDDNDDSM